MDVDENLGIDHYVVVEAQSHSDAVSFALDIGLYFDGVENCGDCECCGDRWSFPYLPPTSTPQVYGDDVKFVSEGGNCYVHYLDGTVKMAVG